AMAVTLAAMWTAMPPTRCPPSRNSISPACSPPRMSIPRARIDSWIAAAARIARPGRSKGASIPAPGESMNGAWSGGGCVDRGAHAVAGGLDEPPLEPGDVVSTDLVVRLEHGLPPTVAHGGGQVGRVHDVGEQHGGQDAIGHGSARDTAQKLFDAVEDLAGMLGHEDPVHPWQLDEPRVGNVLGKVASMVRRDHPVSGPIEDESR